MPIRIIEATHVEVKCELCSTTLQLCCKRDLQPVALANAVERFQKAGWHHDPVARGNWRTKSTEQIEREGSGRWYCPNGCAQTAR
jgi:hypothetical protein